jgi:hypothetical protein
MAEYSPSALKAMREDPKTDRQAAAAKIAEAAGGKLVAIYGISHNGPGVITIVDETKQHRRLLLGLCAVPGGVALSCRSRGNLDTTATIAARGMTIWRISETSAKAPVRADRNEDSTEPLSGSHAAGGGRSSPPVASPERSAPRGSLLRGASFFVQSKEAPAYVTAAPAP